MMPDVEQLKKWVDNVAASIDKGHEPDLQLAFSFLSAPNLSFRVIDLLSEIAEADLDTQNAYYSACIYVLDTCVAQLQSAQENGNKLAAKLLKQLMDYLAKALRQGTQSLSYWLPVLNAFYDVQVELTPDLQDAYLDLAEDEPVTTDAEVNHLEVMREMILEMANLSVFDIAENFFAQSYAMPAEFFCDFIVDLYNIPEAQDMAVFTLLYPRAEVRDVVVATFEELIDTIVLTPISLTRLQWIRHWYPPEYQAQIDRWIKVQRKKGVVFHAEKKIPKIKTQATEVDGAGAQGFYMQVKQNKQQRLCGLLIKQGAGVKDVWVTPDMTEAEISHSFEQIDDGTVTFRNVDTAYLQLMVNHFLAITLANGCMPDLHFLEVQELLGLSFKPKRIDVGELLEQLCVQITPFTHEFVLESFQRSKQWTKNKKFTESWYSESANVDKWVNQCCSIVDGVKICNLVKATEAVFNHELEQYRHIWCFHFLWMALWVMAGVARKNEKIGLDCLMIAYAIHNGTPLAEIPIMQEICRQTVINSVETMGERRTYLS